MTTNGLLHGGREELSDLFVELAEEVDRSGTELEILMVGGSWLLWYGERRATRDVDSACSISDEAVGAIASVAGHHDMDSDWVNNRARPFLPLDFDHSSARTVFQRKSLTVLTPPPETIFLMKLYRADAQDREDMILLWKHCGFATADEVVERYRAAYPHAPGDPHLGSYVKAIIADATA